MYQLYIYIHEYEFAHLQICLQPGFNIPCDPYEG